ncbi:hypothetical protein ACQUSR_12760 [Streptomyces sp. P1-3]|uniref:hypothetical protein n=1 Tax=Streptomyces sp. P1-3 TaxID=3421658 RepID=UPI003D366C07
MRSRALRLSAATLVGVLAVTGLATGCKKSRGGDSHGFGGGDHGGVSEGVTGGDIPTGMPTGIPTDLPSGVPTGMPSDVPPYTPSPSYSPPATYNPDAMSEVDASNCDYDESSGQLKYDVTITNTDTTRSFTYSISVSWTQGSGLVGYYSKTITVLPGSTRTFTAADTSTSYDKYKSSSCEVSTATKSPA